MENISADIYSQDSIKNFQSVKCPQHKCEMLTLYRKIESDNGITSYANPTRFCPQCFDITKQDVWVERPAGYIPYTRDNKGNPFNHGGH